MRGSRVWMVGVFAGVTSCVTSPFSGTPVAAERVTPVEFTGVALPGPRLSVAIEALGSDGSWTNLGSSAVDAEGRWNVSTNVLASYFEPCNRAVFRAVPSDGTRPLQGVSQSCLQTVGVAPVDYSKCGTETIVLRRPGAAPSAFTGDLSIVGQAGAAKYGCYDTVNGNLFVDGDYSRNVSLGKLQHVTGNVEVELNHFVELSQTGGEIVTTELQTPFLSQIGGDVTLRAIREEGGSNFTYHFGLNSVTSLGGNLFIDNQADIVHYGGLSNVESIAGNVTYEWTSSDLLESFMPKLSHIGGDLTLQTAGNLQHLLTGLASVDGDVSLHSASAGADLQGVQVLTSLTSVGGNLTWSSIKVACDRWPLPSLAEVGGELHLLGSSPRHPFGIPALALGGFELSDTGVKMLPLTAETAFAPTGTFTVSNNANLCQCEVDAFASSLAAQGFSGAVTTSNNGSAAACTPCPTPSCL